MIVAGYAVAYHGFPRFTKDIDVFYDISPENTRRLRRALVESKFREESLPSQALETLGNIAAINEIA